MTADFTYIRYHGRKSLYAANYSKRVLSQEAELIQNFQGRDIEVFAYFNNDAEGYAIKNARVLRSMLI